MRICKSEGNLNEQEELNRLEEQLQLPGLAG